MIRFENVGMRYGPDREVLRDLTFELEPGSFQFLSGPSGAGKTSLLRLLFMSLQPTRGLIKVFGRDVASLTADDLPALRRRIGIVFQDFRLLNHLTLYENVALPLRVRGHDEVSYRSDVVELLKWVGLAERVHAFPSVLSGGEQQRAAVARALIDRPELLLADEPTGNLDSDNGRAVMEKLQQFHEEGSTFVMVTHSPEDAKYASRVVELFDGVPLQREGDYLAARKAG